MKLYLSIIATDNIVAKGLAISIPAISGAEPWIGSYIPNLPSPKDADGNIPIDPVIMEASSDKISPNIFEVTITSNCAGFLTSCIDALSIYIWFSFTSSYSLETSITVSLHSLELSKTFALSTLVTFLFLFIAVSKAILAILLTSSLLYFSVSKAASTPSSTTLPRLPK